MKKIRLFIASLLVLFVQKLNAQDILPTYRSEKFKSMEAYGGLAWNGSKNLSFAYQQNIEKGFAWIIITHLQFSNSSLTASSKYFRFNWVQTAGIGTTLGNKRFNSGLYLVGGARFYYSKLTDNPSIFHEPILITNKLMPELGLLYNLKVGKKKFYFTSQIYVSAIPFKNFYENPHTVSIGVGYRFKIKS